MNNIIDLSIKFKDKEILNLQNFTLSKIGILIINELAFNFIIYFWYLLYIFGVISSPNPFFALVLSLFQNSIIFIYLLMHGLTRDDLIKYLFVLIIFKIMPIYSMRYDMNVSYFDVYFTVYLYIIYIFIVLVLYNLILRRNTNVENVFKTDITNAKYDTNMTSNAYDTVYNDMILRII
jgi:hypothetical protein